MVLRVPSKFKVYLSSIGIFIFIFSADALLPAQGDILISDSLTAHAEILDVSNDNLTSKNPKVSIGDYTVISDRGTGETYYHTKNSLLGAKTKSEVTTIISFFVVSNTADTAFVTTEDKSIVQAYYPNVILPNFPLEFMADAKSVSFTAWIIIKGDNAATWMLSIQTASLEEGGLPIAMMLTDGVRIIDPVMVTSDANFDYDHPFRSMLKMPAMGIEFFENGQSLCALQYFGVAAYRPNRNTRQSSGCKAWMRKDLDVETKLVLTAAMSTFLLTNDPSSSTD